MTNRRRGEAAVVLGGRRHRLRLTLGALAELEAAFAVDGLAALGQRLSRGLAGRDLVAILGAALRGGGHPISDEEVAALPIDGGLPAIAAAVADALALAFGEGAPNPPRPQAPRATRGTSSSGS